MARFDGWKSNRAPVTIGTGPDMTKTLVIGIDPDVERSGVASVNKATGARELFTAPFWDVIGFINQFRDHIRVVVIEAGFLNPKSNFRDRAQIADALQSNNAVAALASAKRVGEKIAQKVGQNHQVGILLVEYCRRENIPFMAVQPIGHKITSTRMFQQMYGIKTAKADQEIRDAFHLIAGF